VGQLLERLIGLNNTSNNLDFEDGELKTNKCDKNGKPLETVFITQISNIVDELLSGKKFETTHLYEKIGNLLYVPVSKVGSESEWMLLGAIHIRLDDPQFSDLKTQLSKDYYSIVQQLNNHIASSPDGFIHTSNGYFIQIRSKDSKPYHPIYSNIYNKYVSNKNHAFYFKKEFAQYFLAK
jgi:DNA mismatch repair protein MutH